MFGVAVSLRSVTQLRIDEVLMRGFPSVRIARSQRISATIPISLVLQGEDPKTEHDAYTVNISSKGARIRTVFVLSPGQMVGIVLDGDARGAITSRVVWVERSSVVGSLAGLEFLDTLPT
jgi:hypothetical protein